MRQELELSHEEKIKMYQKFNKDELIEMLIEANNILNLSNNIPRRVFKIPVGDMEASDIRKIAKKFKKELNIGKEQLDFQQDIFIPTKNYIHE